MVHALTEVVAATRVHVAVAKCPPFPPSLQDTIPVGVVFVPTFVSTTLALNVTVFPRFTDDGFGVTVVLVEFIAYAERPAGAIIIVSTDSSNVTIVSEILTFNRSHKYEKKY